MYGQILALLASLCGAYSSIVYSRIGQKVDSDILAYIRMCIAFPLMAAWALLADGAFFLTAPAGDILLLLASGFVGFFITDMYLFRAYAVYGANETMVIMCLAPILSSLMSVLCFDEILNPAQYIAVVLAVVGVVCVTGSEVKGKKLFSYGLICALIAAFFQSESDMLAKTALSDMPHTTSAAIRAFGGMIGWIVYALFKIKGKIKTNETLHSSKFIIFFIFTVIIGTIVGTTFAVGSLKYAPAGIATSLKQISPIFILPYDFFVLKKKSKGAVIGTLITVVGVILFFL